jgi:hypothetical protein
MSAVATDERMRPVAASTVAMVPASRTGRVHAAAALTWLSQAG